MESFDNSTKDREPPQGLKRYVALFFMLTLFGLLLYTFIYTDLPLLLKHIPPNAYFIIAGLITLFILMRAVHQFRRDNLRPTTLTLSFTDEAQFRARFPALMERVGFSIQPNGPDRYVLQARSSLFRLLPRAWFRIEAHIEEQRVVLHGTSAVLRATKTVLQHQLQREQELRLPY
jgi:hypothetical protein